MDMLVDERQAARKRKSKAAVQTPDLNFPAAGSQAIIPIGLVNSRVSQLGGGSESSWGSLEETKKKQRRGSTTTQDRRRLRMTAPAWRHENVVSELLGSGVARGSSRIM